MYKGIDLSQFPDEEVITLSGSSRAHETLRSWFPDLDVVDKNSLQITKESVFSLSRKDAAEDLSAYIEQLLEEDDDPSILTITDATANVGGNTLSFAKHFGAVNAIEINPLACQALRNNIEVYGVAAKVQVRNADYLQVANELSQDIIFFDPPWGGPDYWKEDSIMLELSGKPLYEVINELTNKPKLVVLKVPKNFAFKEFMERVKGKYKWYKKYKNHCMILIKDELGDSE